MPKYEVSSKQVGHKSIWLGEGDDGHRVEIKAGSIVEMDEEDAAQFGDTLQLVEEGDEPTLEERLNDDSAKKLDGPMKPHIATTGPADLEGAVYDPAATAEALAAPQTAAQARRSNAGDADKDAPVDESDVEDLLDGPGQEVISNVKTIDDVDMLKTIKSAEKKGKNRTTVIDAIDHRIANLKG